MGKKPRIKQSKREEIFKTSGSEQFEKIELNVDVILQVAEIANTENIDVYIVGGFVRDYLLNRPRTDYDFTVVGDALEFAKKVARHFKVKPVVFERFRTAMVPLKDGLQLEFVGTRKEEYLPNSRKPIVTVGSLYDDIARRDFTINTLAASLKKNELGKVVNIFNGIEDIKQKIIRTPLNPEITFSDDPLRMMRAARFASQLNYEIHPDTFTAMKKMAPRLKIISQERISNEFLKILESNQPSVGIKILSETGLLSQFFPEFEQLKGVDIKTLNDKVYAHKDVFYHTLKVVDNIAPMTNNVWLRFAALLHDIAKPRTKRYNPTTGWTFHGHEELGAKMVAKIFRNLKLPTEQQEYVEKLVRLHLRPMVLVDDGVTDSAVRRLAVNAGDALEDLFTLCKADITTKNPKLGAQYLNNYDSVLQKILEVQEKDKLREFQSPVRGEEIMQHCRLAPCKAVGIIKSNIEDAILDGIIPNEYDAAKDYFVNNIEVWINDIEPRFIIWDKK